MSKPIDRWLGLACCLWMLACAGMAPTFGVYSPLIKSLGHYNQKVISALAVAKDAGENVGLISGLLCDLLPAWALLLIGTAHFTVGFGVLWTICAGILPTPGFLTMFCILFMASQGTVWFVTATLVTCVRNFPDSRGTVVGVMKSLVGLSGAIFTLTYSAFLAPHEDSFIGMLAIMPAVITLPLMHFLRPAVRSGSDSLKREALNFKFLMVTCVCLALFLSALNAIEAAVDLSSQVKCITLAAAGLLFSTVFWVPLSYFEAAHWLFHPFLRAFGEDVPSTSAGAEGQLTQGLLSSSAGEAMEASEGCEATVPIRSGDPQKGMSEDAGMGSSPAEHKAQASESLSQHCGDSKSAQQDECRAQEVLPDHSAEERDQCSSGVEWGLKADLSDAVGSLSESGVASESTSPALLLALGEGAVPRNTRRGPRRGEDFTLLQAVVKADYILVAVIFMIGTGSSATVINNLAQIGHSLGYDNVRLFVSLISVSNFFGRLGGGYISEDFVRRWLLPRPLMLVVAQLGLGVAHLCLSIGFPGALHIGCMLVGCGYGIHCSVMPAAVSELFGLKHFGTLFNAVLCVYPIGSYLLSSLLAGTLYDLETKAQGGDVDGKECLGVDCFRMTFICVSFLCMLGSVCGLVLVMRTRRVYRMMYGPVIASSQ